MICHIRKCAFPKYDRLPPYPHNGKTIQVEGGVQVQDDHDVLSERVLILIKVTACELLKPGESINLSEVIGAIYRTSLCTQSPVVKRVCEEAIRRLTKKLN